MMTSTVYLNGELVPEQQARIPVSDAGLLYGLGYFETFRTSGGWPHHWTFNRRRLLAACQRAHLTLAKTSLAFDEPRLHATVRELLARNRQIDAVFRYTITAGTDGNATELLTMRALPAMPPDAGIALRVLRLRRDRGEWWPRPKSLNYSNAILGANELETRAATATDEGLFLSQHEDVIVETPRQNVAWIIGDSIQTPDPTTGAVAGTCLAWLNEMGLAIEPVGARLSHMLKSDAVFCANAVRGITPVAQLWDETDRQLLHSFSSATHPVVVDLRRRWRAALAVTADK
ncbi:MAG: aminotransferase class IV [Opitutus sp.]